MTRDPARSGDDPIRLSTSLERLRVDLELPAPGVVDEVERVWHEVTPPELVSRTRVRSLREGRLTIEATPEAAGQLRYLESALVTAADRAFGPGVVTGLVVVVVPEIGA